MGCFILRYQLFIVYKVDIPIPHCFWYTRIIEFQCDRKLDVTLVCLVNFLVQYHMSDICWIDAMYIRLSYVYSFHGVSLTNQETDKQKSNADMGIHRPQSLRAEWMNGLFTTNIPNNLLLVEPAHDQA